jgi:hypothetical protein
LPQLSASSDDEQAVYHTYDTSLLFDSRKEDSTMLVKKIPKIRFHLHVSVNETLHFKNYSQTEVEHSWYNEKELECIREEIQDILLNNLQVLEDPDYDFVLKRGLEGMTAQGSKRQEQNRRAGWAAVLRDKQSSSLGSDNSSGIALAYSLVSQWSVMEAVQRAKEDNQISQQSQKIQFQAKTPIFNRTTWKISPKQASGSFQRLLRKLSGC